MVLLNNTYTRIYNKYYVYCLVKTLNNKIYLKNKQGLLKINILTSKNINIQKIYVYIFCIYSNLSKGWITILFLNGLGFKATRKYSIGEKKYWRFNLGHSHIYYYFTPLDIIYIMKTRFIYNFSFNKEQLHKTTKYLQTFKKYNIYKGTGIEFPSEIKILKPGKVKQ